METTTQKILTKYPYFIASRYGQLVETNIPQQKVEMALNIYEVSIRALALSLINQYLIKDKESEDYLSDALRY